MTATRPRTLARLDAGEFDLLVVGGGATGAAVARDAALRGLEVALLDGGDWASATSSASSKLIHGGLRYLQHGNFHLVFEALAERQRLMRTAPHLCRPVPFLFPAYRGAHPSLGVLQMGVFLYDALALWRPPARSRQLFADEVHRISPYLRSAGLMAAERYFDCATDDARLVLENVLDAEEAGACVASRVLVERVGSRGPGGRQRVEALDRQTGARLTLVARLVVNATGPFSDTFAGGTRHHLRPTLGVHAVFDAGRLPHHEHAVVLTSPRDGRIMFCIPAGPRTIVGTTDTDWRAPDGTARPPCMGDRAQATRGDVDYLLETANASFPPARLRGEDVLSTFAGWRPLVAGSWEESPSATSREHEIELEDDVLAVRGGKLTAMRSMAEQAVDRAVEVLRSRGHDRPIGRCSTRHRPLPGARALPAGSPALAPALDAETERHLERYGTRAALVRTLVAAEPAGNPGRVPESARDGLRPDLRPRDPALRSRVEPELPFIWAEVLHAVRYEHAEEVEDVLARRLPLLRDARDQGAAAAEPTSRILAAELDWSESKRRASVETYLEAIALSNAWRG